MTTENKQFYSVPETAALLCISKSKMWRVVRANEIKVMKIGHRVIITNDAIREFVDKNQDVWKKGVDVE